MKINNKKILFLIAFFIFFFSIPFIQSFLFSTNHKGRMEINKIIKADFIKSDKKIVLLFFGYVGCQDVCTPFLTKLSTIYKSKEFKEIKNDVEILFVNLTPNIDKSQADIFAKYFNKNFHGVYLSKHELFSVDRKFSLFFSQSLNEKSEVNHTDYLYLINNRNNKLVLNSFYSIHPLEKEKLINDIITLKQNSEGV